MDILYKCGRATANEVLGDLPGTSHWVACRRLWLESEHACDDEVMRRGADGADYATHLLDLARALNQRRYMWFSAPAMARPSSLERRVRAMLNNGLDRGSLSRSARAAIFVTLLGVATAVAAAQSGFAAFSGSIADDSSRGIPKPGAACVPASEGGRIVPPRKIRDYAPVFPANLRGTGVNSTVVMEGRVALDGYITDIRIVGDAHPDLASAAVAAVREWKYTQTLLNCQPVDVLMTITVNFKTGPPPPPPAPR